MELSNVYAPRSAWPRKGQTYTSDQIKVILMGLARGSRARPISDAEYRARMDPHGHYEAQLLSILSDIRDFFVDRGKNNPPPSRPSRSESGGQPARPKQGGGVPLS